MAGAVPSTLHQNLKFVWNHQEIVIHGEGNNSIYPENSIPVIESVERLDGSVFHIKETMCTTRAERVKLPRVLMMVAWEMLKNGFKPGRGLGVNLDGIVEPIQLPGQKDTFGLGYEPTLEEISLASLKRKGDIPLPKPVPLLNQSFFKASVTQVPEKLLKTTSWKVSRIYSLPRKKLNAINQTSKSADTVNMTRNETSEPILNAEQDSEEYEEDMQPEELTKDFEHFENKPKPNLDETETINLGDSEIVRETRISVHLTPSQREELINLLRQYIDVFAWSYDDMSGLSTDIVSHKLPIDPSCPPVKQKKRNIKPDLSLKVKEEVSKQFDAKSFVDCFAGYHQILMDEEDRENGIRHTLGSILLSSDAFWTQECGATYMRAMTTIFHDMIHKEIEVYVDDIIIKSRKSSDHLTDLKKFFDEVEAIQFEIKSRKVCIWCSAGKLLGFIVSRRGIELDPSKIKAIQELPAPKSRKDVMSFLGRLNYISRFIAQSTVICEPIIKLLRKDAATKWTEDCQRAFDKIKEYLSNPPVLVPPEAGRPLLLYLSVSANAFGCVLGQHDETGKKEQAIYYLSKKFTPYEARYTLLERTCCSLTWVAQKLRHYLSAYTTYLISRMDPLKYIFQKPMPTGKLAKWQILLSEFDIVYVTQKAIKGRAIADHLSLNIP
ncbi:uncharacterized protein LOC132066075 [Lycium ferocissimum]|uniref:uncharacterized protein LOC132066075 n=1 Tax=Lycium ferocissimum TaxID=112874 RepID=UPI002815547C|nr:uncharacterized protein LOC132066075 [Lycium ferocissimum]